MNSVVVSLMSIGCELLVERSAVVYAIENRNTFTIQKHQEVSSQLKLPFRSQIINFLKQYFKTLAYVY